LDDGYITMLVCLRLNVGNFHLLKIQFSVKGGNSGQLVLRNRTSS